MMVDIVVTPLAANDTEIEYPGEPPPSYVTESVSLDFVNTADVPFADPLRTRCA